MATHRRRRSKDASGSLPSTSGTLSTAIIGGGIGGLACACVLQRMGAPVTVYERDSSIDAGQGGEIQLPNAAAALYSIERLTDESSAWEALRAKSRSPRDHSVPIRALRSWLACQLRCGTIQYSTEVVDLLQSPDGSTGCVYADGRFPQPYDVVVDAGGLSSPLFRSSRGHHQATRHEFGQSKKAHAAIGDAQAARASGLRSLLLGIRRNRYGGDNALREGVALGALLGGLVTRKHSTTLRTDPPRPSAGFNTGTGVGGVCTRVSDVLCALDAAGYAEPPRRNTVWPLVLTSASWYAVFAYATALAPTHGGLMLTSAATVFCTATLSWMHWADYLETGVRMWADKVMAHLSFFYFTAVAISRVREVSLLLFGWPLWVLLILSYRLSKRWGHAKGNPEFDNARPDRWVWAHATFHICVGIGQTLIIFGTTLPSAVALFL